MKRRNGECPKLRRPVKRSKITDGIYGSTIVYLKFFMLWALVLLADFLLEFRFEFLWPFWLLLRSVYDSYKYQGLAFSVFFVSIALTSDMICYFFIPVQWLFFAASTYVWVQYVWHTEKGICLPTVMLWLLFAYMEAAVRLKDLRHMPFHLDLCRPFAAHCIGYPVVTLGFGFKSYVSFRIRQRKQREVKKENQFYMNLLAQALPIESVQSSNQQQPPDKIKAETSNGVIHHLSCSSTSNKQQRKSVDKSVSEPYANGSAHTEIECTEKLKESDELEIEKEKCPSNNKKKGSSGSQRENRKNQSKNHSKASESPPLTAEQQREEYCLRLECEIKRLKNDLSSSRQNECDLRSQLNSSISSEQRVRAELATLHHTNQDLQAKVTSLNSLRSSEKANLEKRLAEERRGRAAAESALKAAKARAAATPAPPPTPTCGESCRIKRREVEAELKALRREMKMKEEKAAQVDRELQSLLQYKETQAGSEVLMAAVTALQDKNSHLETSLSAETRIKMDLFSALGEAKRHVEISNNMIRSKEREIEELKGKMAQVLAVMPPSEFSPLGLGPSVVGGQLKLRGILPESTLDPNASVYTPKQGHLTTEA
ncbi:macoilin [Halyomorpha halys]|uniref:macoilin n=1 Tax=Halyomorpha halys TaxID=286706 RepID=UPI0006D52604|nr:macoilin [Halyomorpha halys]